MARVPSTSRRRGYPRRRRGRIRRQTRQSLRHQSLRQRRCAGSIGRAYRSWPRTGGTLRAGSRLRLHVRPRLSSRHEARWPDAPRNWHSHRLQHPRPAHQSRPYALPVARRGRWLAAAQDGRSAAASRLPARADYPRRRRHRRVLAQRANRICEVRRGQELREYTITPEEVGLTRISNRSHYPGWRSRLQRRTAQRCT